MPTIKKDTDALIQGLEGGVKRLLGDLIDGTIEDLDGPIRETAARMATAAQRGRFDLVEASRDQLALIVVEKELRLKQGAGELFDDLLGLGIKLLFDGAVAGLSGLKVTP